MAINRGMQKKKKRPGNPTPPRPSTITYRCLRCEIEEEIPYQVVREMDKQDMGDPSVPPQFACEACGGAMYPRYYKGVHGFEYRISDVIKTQRPL